MEDSGEPESPDGKGRVLSRSEKAQGVCLVASQSVTAGDSEKELRVESGLSL